MGYRIVVVDAGEGLIVVVLDGRFFYTYDLLSRNTRFKFRD